MVRYFLPALIGLLGFAAADITIELENVSVIGLDKSLAATSAQDLFALSCNDEIEGRKTTPQVLLTSYAPFTETTWTSPIDNSSAFVISAVRKENLFANSTIYPSSSSLVRAAIEAWGQHQHLVIRPDEVWFEILSQLNFYMNRNANLVRQHFVSHDGQEQIQIVANGDDEMISAFGSKIQERVKTKWLLDWIKPGFSTSTHNDEITAQVLLMGLTKQYFKWFASVLCGLPSVTLLGQKEDWVQLLQKLDHLADFGPQPAEYATVLRPILTRFVRTWEEGDSPEIKEFWLSIVRGRRRRRCGEVFDTTVHGWITGFFFWGEDGRVLGSEDHRRRLGNTGARLDGIRYIPREVEALPISHANAPVHVRFEETGAEMDVILMAGNIGIERKTVDDKVTAKPLSGWFVYGPVDPTVDGVDDYGSRSELRSMSKSIETCLALDLIKAEEAGNST
ncbi:hypothetical protein CDD81_7104 [Ophiocordyceps australis]|uniref:Heterokaryon incompatibility domain-containing protein n=1 Tax=Ophiocordyceps australis TaxID=1399860 RepID=A0A2C5Y191_9HYPO|nr:hypothetical protein CDD81_7104 [Ophiocordyceps australis]